LPSTGVFTPVLAKHTKNLSLVDVLSIGIDRIQRNFEPIKKQVEAWKTTRIPGEAAKLVIVRLRSSRRANRNVARRVLTTRVRGALFA